VKHSIKRTITLATVGGILILLASSLVYVDWRTRDLLLTRFDQDLLVRARSMTSMVEVVSGTVAVDFEDTDMTEFQDEADPSFLEVSISGGAVLYRSPSLHGADLASLPASVSDPAFAWVVGPTAGRRRAVVVPFHPRIDEDSPPSPPGDSTGSPPRVLLRLARPTSEVDAVASDLRRVLILLGLLASLGSGAWLWIAVHRGFLPLAVISRQIARISGERLSDRIRSDSTPAELEEIVTVLNDLLERLEHSFQRERTLSSNLAHELRTPLAGLRSALDVALLRPRSSEEYGETLKELSSMVGDMERMAERLLHLSRLYSGRVPVEKSEVDVADLLEKVWTPIKSEAEAKSLTIGWKLDEVHRTSSDPTLLQIVFRNLLENAVAHADRGGFIEVASRRMPNGFQLEFRNSGATVDAGRLNSLLDPFTRGDAERSNTGRHAGLGLPLTKRLCEILDVDLSLRVESDKTFHVQLEFPFATRNPPGTHRPS